MLNVVKHFSRFVESIGLATWERCFDYAQHDVLRH